jgi:leucyl/phenylalanyl-tRNA---protein transferase
LSKALRRNQLQITTDHAFSEVLRACAGPRSGSSGTWLSSEMQAAYLRLHQLGHAHSVEVWDHSTLVGGLYGVALPGIFFGESMFSRQTNASKFALAWLCDTLPTN